MRLGSPVEAKEKEKISTDVDLVESRKHEEPSLLPISENEKKFNIGKNTVQENKQVSRRTLRTGLQKEVCTYLHEEDGKAVQAAVKEAKPDEGVEVTIHAEENKILAEAEKEISKEGDATKLPKKDEENTQVQEEQEQTPIEAEKEVNSGEQINQGVTVEEKIVAGDDKSGKDEGDATKLPKKDEESTQVQEEPEQTPIEEEKEVNSGEQINQGVTMEEKIVAGDDKSGNCGVATAKQNDVINKSEGEVAENGSYVNAAEIKL